MILVKLGVKSCMSAKTYFEMSDFTFSLLFLFYLLLCVVASCFLCRWLVKRLVQSRWGKRHTLLADFRPCITLLLTPICALALYVALFLSALSIYSHVVYDFPAHPFNQTDWRSQPDKRYEMTEDLLARRLLIGKTHAEVIALLGDDYFRGEDTEIIYTIGFVPQFMTLDPDVLIISFQDGRVVKVEQQRN